MTDPTPVRIVISPARHGYTVTTYAEQTSTTTAETLEQARTFAQQLAATAKSGYRIVEETRLVYPLYME